MALTIYRDPKTGELVIEIASVKLLITTDPDQVLQFAPTEDGKTQISFGESVLELQAR